MSGITVLDHGRRSSGRVGPAVVGPGNMVSASQKVGPPPVQVRSRVGAVGGLKRGITQTEFLGFEERMAAVLGRLQGIEQMELADIGVKARGQPSAGYGRQGWVSRDADPQYPYGTLSDAELVETYRTTHDMMGDLPAGGQPRGLVDKFDRLIREILRRHLEDQVNPNPDGVSTIRGLGGESRLAFRRRIRSLLEAPVRPSDEGVITASTMSPEERREFARQLRARRGAVVRPGESEDQPQSVGPFDWRGFNLIDPVPLLRAAKFG